MSSLKHLVDICWFWRKYAN